MCLFLTIPIENFLIRYATIKYRRAWTSRGELDPSRDCKAVAIQILAQRTEQARMHNYPSYACYATADTMAGAAYPNVFYRTTCLECELDLVTCSSHQSQNSSNCFSSAPILFSCSILYPAPSILAVRAGVGRGKLIWNHYP